MTEPESLEIFGRRVTVYDLSNLLGNETSAFEVNPHAIEYVDGYATASLGERLLGVPRDAWPDGQAWNAEQVSIHTHSGTHIDAPHHYGPAKNGRARTIDEVPLGWCFGPGVLLDMRHKARGEGITKEDVKAELERIGHSLVPLEIVLVMTGASRHFGEPGDHNASPGLRRDATESMVDQGIRLIGIDAWGLDRPMDVMAAEAVAGDLSGDQTVRVPEYWYEKPAFYFGNHHAILGPGQAVQRPAGCEWLDFELEIAAIADGRGGIAGFTLLNDWSARDIQRREGTVGLGVHKSKDFGTSLGPWLVTPDELPYENGKLAVKASVTVDGERRVETNSNAQFFAWPQMLEAAARGTKLAAGDVLGSGTLDFGCIAEMGPLDQQRWVRPRETVSLAADGLGELSTPVRQAKA